MKDRLTRVGKSGHTNNMEDRGESPVLTEVGKALKEADAFADKFANAMKEHVHKEAKQRAEAEAEKKRQKDSEERRKEEDRIRNELKNTKHPERAVSPEDQEREFNDLVSQLPKKEQAAYRQLMNGMADTTQRSSFLNSIRALVKGEASGDDVQAPEDTLKMKIEDVVGNSSLERFFTKRVTPKVEEVSKKILQHVEEQGADQEQIITLQRQIKSAVEKDTFEIKQKAKKGEWDKIQKRLSQMLQDLEQREKELVQETKDSQSNDLETKKHEKLLPEQEKSVEVQHKIQEATNRFKDGEEKLTQGLQNTVSKSKDPINRISEQNVLKNKTPETVVTEAKERFKNAVGQSDEDRVSKGKLEVLRQEVEKNAMLSPEDRIRKATEILRQAKLLNRELHEKEANAILDAHKVGEGETGLDGRKAEIENFTLSQLLRKGRILRGEGGFDDSQIRLLMEHGITGPRASSVIEDRAVISGTEASSASNSHTPTADAVEEYIRSISNSKVDAEEKYTLSVPNKDEKGYWDPDTLQDQNAQLVKEVVGKTVLDDVEEWEEDLETDNISESYSGYLHASLADTDTFSIKRFNNSITSELFRLHTLSQNLPIDMQQNVEDVISKLGTKLNSLSMYQNQHEQIEQELSHLKDEYWMTDGSREAKQKIQDAEKRLKELETRFKSNVRPLINELENVSNQAHQQVTQRENSGSGDERNLDSGRPVVPPGGGVGRGGGGGGGPEGGENGGHFGGRRERRIRGGGGEAPPPPPELGLRGRGEGDEAEEDPLGRSVRSIEDLGHFMELVTAEFRGKIMASLYRGEDGSIITEEDLLSDVTDLNQQEEMKSKNRLYAFKVGQGEYAMDYLDTKVPNNYKVPDDERGNRVLMLTAEEIKQIDSRMIDPQTGRPWARHGGQNAKDYWEAVRIVRPDQFMNWVRSYWTLIHGDDPDNPVNFFQEIIVNHPDQRGAVNVGVMHKNAGTYLRSRFLTDPSTGELRVFNQLRNQIINEVWVPSGERNKEVLYKKIMHADEELPKVMRDQITADNLAAKISANGKNTLAMFFTLPEHFQDDFDWRTGKEKTQSERAEDIKFGAGILLAYEMYYNISDIEGMKRLIGNNASFFTRDAITRAVLEVAGEEMPEKLDKSHYEFATQYLIQLKDPGAGTVIDASLYDEKGKVDESNKKNLNKWLQFMNPYYPVQKDVKMLGVIRKVVENQLQEIIGIEKGASGSELAELHAYMRTFHDGVAARHDVRMGNRNSQTKYEFVGAPGGYQDKQFGRDRAGNLYNKGLLWRTTVGMLHAMPTRNGEAVQDILHHAISIQMNALHPYRDLLDRIKRGEVPDSRYEEIKEQIARREDFEDDPEANALLAQIRKIDKDYKKLKEDGFIKDAQAKSHARYRLINETLELHLRKKYEPLATAWETYNKNIPKTNSDFNSVLGRLEFDEAQYTQYGGMHYSNSTGLFHMEMESQDLPLDKLSGRDYQGRLFFKTEEFGGWLEGMEKRMRYTIETWPLPLGATERRLVNPRTSEPPKFVEMPLVESIFGSYDYTGARNGGVMEMAQRMINRKLKDPINFTDGKGNIVTVIPKEENGQIERDKLGNPIMIPDYESPQALERREALRKIVGYVDYDKDENGRIIGINDIVKPLVNDPASFFTKAYVKVRIANFILAHTDKYSPYEKWTIRQREDFFHSLMLSSYFSEIDIDDIREFSDNKFWKNFRREALRETGLGAMQGILDAFKTFFKGAVS